MSFHHKETDLEEQQTKDLTVGILTVFQDDGKVVCQQVNNIAAVLEENTVLQDLSDLPTAFAYLLGLIYAVNIKYTKDRRYTFETVQNLFMGLGTDYSARVRSLPELLTCC